MVSKLLSISEAINLIQDNSTITFSGVSMVRKPMGFIREIIRADKKGLYLIDREAGSQGY